MKFIQVKNKPLKQNMRKHKNKTKIKKQRSHASVGLGKKKIRCQGGNDTRRPMFCGLHTRNSFSTKNKQNHLKKKTAVY